MSREAEDDETWKLKHVLFLIIPIYVICRVAVLLNAVHELSLPPLSIIL